MYAIIQSKGKQYRVKPGDIIEVEHTGTDVNQNLNFEEVLLIQDNDNIEFGAPYIQGAKVEARLLEHRKAKKIVVFKMKRRKRYRRKLGHRQLLSKAKILEIKKSLPEISPEKISQDTEEGATD